MNRSAQRRKNAIRWAIALVVLLDLLLIVVNWRASATDPKALQRQKSVQQRQHDLLAADVNRAASIRQSLPAVQ